MTAQPHRTAMQPTVSTGTSARQLSPAAPWRPAKSDENHEQPRRRTPLSVVPAPLPKTGKGFIALCALMLIAALGAVLAINITVSNRQYDLVSLRAEHTTLTQTNERLTQQTEYLAAPQNLAAKAAELGMVLPGDVAAINLETGQVTGEASAALEENKPTDFVAAPTVPGGQEAGEDDAATENAPVVEDDPFAGQELNGGSIPAPQLQTPAP